MRFARRFPPYHEIPEPAERRRAVVGLHAEGWSAKAIAGYLGVHRSTVHRVLRRWVEEGVEGLEDRPHGRPPGVRKAKGKQPVERKRAMALAQARKVDAVLVTELTRWGRSTQDLMDTLGQLASWDVSLIAQTGLTFDLSTPQGKLIANLMASLAEFEHDLLRERVRSGIAAAKARGQTFGRKPGYRPSDKHAPETVRLAEDEGLSQRAIAERLGISKTTVNEVLKRRRSEAPTWST